MGYISLKESLPRTRNDYSALEIGRTRSGGLSSRNKSATVSTDLCRQLGRLLYAHSTATYHNLTLSLFHPIAQLDAVMSIWRVSTSTTNTSQRPPFQNRLPVSKRSDDSPEMKETKSKCRRKRYEGESNGRRVFEERRTAGGDKHISEVRRLRHGSEEHPNRRTDERRVRLAGDEVAPVNRFNGQNHRIRRKQKPAEAPSGDSPHRRKKTCRRKKDRKESAGGEIVLSSSSSSSVASSPQLVSAAHPQPEDSRQPEPPVPPPRPKPPTLSWEREDDDSKPERYRGRWGKQNDEDKKKPIDNKAKPDFGLSGKLVEEANTYKGVIIKYSQPQEARMPKRRWRLYPFKGDEALPTLYIHRQSAYLIGRERKVVDIPVDHPSISKQHAVLQYRLVPYSRDDGTKGQRIRPYIIDLESANGTFVNNQKIDHLKYVELLERDVVKFAFSSREYVLLHEHSSDGHQDDEAV